MEELMRGGSRKLSPANNHKQMKEEVGPPRLA